MKNTTTTSKNSHFWVCAVLLFLPLSAYCRQSADVAGTWTGKLGNQEIVACFHRGDKATSSGSIQSGYYYYQRHGKAIPLTPVVGHTDQWSEQADSGSTGTWRLEVKDKDRLEGQWLDPKGRRTVSLHLARLKTLISDATWCASPEDASFDATAARYLQTHEPKVIGQKLANGKEYRELSTLDGAVTSIELIGDEAGIKVLNERLSNEMRSGAGAYFGCPTRDEIGTPKGKVKPEYSATIKPQYWNDRWITLVQYVSGDCGGAHPFSSVTRSTWDLTTGKPENLWRWIKGSRKDDATSEFGDYYFSYAPPENLGRMIAQRAVKARLKYNPNEAKDNPNCLDALESNTDYEVSLGTKGLVFSHKFPHVAQACDDDIEIDFDRLSPFLTKAGREHLGKIREASAVK